LQLTAKLLLGGCWKVCFFSHQLTPDLAKQSKAQEETTRIKLIIWPCLEVLDPESQLLAVDGVTVGVTYYLQQHHNIILFVLHSSTTRFVTCGVTSGR
jgi:hypothetical protein